MVAPGSGSPRSSSTIPSTTNCCENKKIGNSRKRFVSCFIDWFFIGFPVTVILIPFVWLFLTKIVFKVSSYKSNALEKTLLKMKKEVGKPSSTEKVIACIFFIVATLWIFRKSLNDSLGLNLNDTSIGIFGALLLFIIPCGSNKRACSWKTANKIPWGVLFLVGGGIALSKAIKDSGLAEWIGTFSSYLYGLDIYLLVLISVATIILLTELNSNTATVATFSPILIIFAIGLEVNPLIFVIPTTIAASCAFMLPIATPPNAVVFGSGKVKINNMMRAGLLLNIISVFVVTVISLIILNQVFDYDLMNLPDWTTKTNMKN